MSITKQELKKYSKVKIQSEIVKPKKAEDNKNQKFDFDDILIQPSKITSIHTRKDVDIHYDVDNFGIHSKLPLIAAPMDTVVSINNFSEFVKLGINICLPRGERLNLKSQTNINELAFGNKMIFVVS